MTRDVGKYKESKERNVMDDFTFKLPRSGLVCEKISHLLMDVVCPMLQTTEEVFAKLHFCSV